jgi:hypothetical protein
MASLPPGVSGKTGLVLNEGQIKFIAALRRAVPASIPIYINSGTRTPEEQAAALKTKRDLGDDLYKLYRADYIIKELMAVPNTAADMAPILRKWVQQGHYLSRHMRGDALDISVWRGGKLTESQINTVMEKARGLGAKAKYETKPPHIHIEAIGGTISDISFAAGEKARKAQRAVERGSTYAQRQAKRSARRALSLYRRRKILYTSLAIGASSLLLMGIFFVSRRRKRNDQ